MKKPHLVQRGKFRNQKEFQGIDSLVEFDYMGSSEFEFGALARALKAICGILPQLNYCPTNIEYDGKTLWLLCKTEDEIPLKEFFGLVAANRFDVNVRTLELLHYGDKMGADGINFWWDLENNWMAVFGQNEIEKVGIALELVKQKKGW